MSHQDFTDSTDLVRCQRCDALYKPGRWSWVRERSHSPTATGGIELIRRVPAGCCPVCMLPSVVSTVVSAEPGDADKSLRRGENPTP